MSHDALFSPLKMGALTLPNRILMAPLTRCRAEDEHVPGPLMAEYYAQRATAGLIVAGAFARALGAEAERFGLSLLGGDTVTTPGPLLVSGTFFGRCPAEGIIPRAGARPGDLLFVTGPIGDGLLGLKAVTGALADPTGRLAGRIRKRPAFPRPRGNASG